MSTTITITTSPTTTGPTTTGHRTTQQHTTTATSVPTYGTWLPWSDATVVATASFEHTFVGELADCAGHASEAHSRRDTTALLNALRGGLRPAELLERAPGLRPGCLYGSYLALEDRRDRAARAWHAILEHPSLDVLATHHVLASRLMPVLVDRLLDAAMLDPRILPRLAGHVANAVAETARMTASIEQELDRCADPERRTLISRTLFDPTADCVYDRVDHLPGRVGSLVPTRVASLLGERHLAPVLPEAS